MTRRALAWTFALMLNVNHSAAVEAGSGSEADRLEKPAGHDGQPRRPHQLQHPAVFDPTCALVRQA